MKHTPNVITSLNLAAGFTAIVFAGNNHLETASWLILAAMIFDFLDGFSARLLKAYSELGKELDSLADVVSFGVAPALILFQLISATSQGKSLADVIVYVPVLMPVCAALRLAKFNIDLTQVSSFKGLPTPANAIAVISVVIASKYSSLAVWNSFAGSTTALLAYTIILSLLMVLNIPLLSLKMTTLKFSVNKGRYILAGIVLISFAISGLGAAPMIIPIYIIVSVFDRLIT